jgi:hypothetical protein
MALSLSYTTSDVAITYSTAVYAEELSISLQATTEPLVDRVRHGWNGNALFIWASKPVWSRISNALKRSGFRSRNFLRTAAF